MCQKRSCRDTTSSCNGERETGLVISSIFFLVRLYAAYFFSGNVIGIHPISVSTGDHKYSFVVSFTSSFVVLTQHFSKSFLVKADLLNLNVQYVPEGQEGNILPKKSQCSEQPMSTSHILSLIQPCIYQWKIRKQIF